MIHSLIRNDKRVTLNTGAMTIYVNSNPVFTTSNLNTLMREWNKVKGHR